MKQISFLVAASWLGLIAGCGSSNTNSGNSKVINGGGSSFVNPIMQEWTSAYEKEKGTRVNYQSIGSGAGIQKMTAHEVDFGCSDAPMNEEQLKKANETGGEVIHVPLVMGAVVPAYNLEEVKEPLRFSGPVLADIYLKKIKKWNDPQLIALNPGANLPDRDIAVAYRSDSSGTTYIWVEYLSKVSPEWKEKIGVGTSVNWPTGAGEKNSEGVAGHIERTPGSLGYMELIYALGKKDMQYGSVKNQAGEFVLGSLESVTAAAAGALTNIPEDLRYSLTNAPGKQAYPISGTTWAVLFTNQAKGEGPSVAEFLRWVTHEGQEKTESLYYARLPKGLLDRVEKKLSQIK